MPVRAARAGRTSAGPSPRPRPLDLGQPRGGYATTCRCLRALAPRVAPGSPRSIDDRGLRPLTRRRRLSGTFSPRVTVDHGKVHSELDLSAVAVCRLLKAE